MKPFWIRQVLLTIIRFAASALLLLFPFETTTVAQTLIPRGEDSLYNGFTIDSIEIDNREIFDTDLPRYDKFLFKLANRLHITTRKKTISREVLFNKGDLYNHELAEETARNLRTRLAITDARVEVYQLTDTTLLVRVVTVDQWSFLITADAEREAAEMNYRIGLEERNLSGNQQFLGIDLFIRDTHDDFVDARFRDRRLSGLPLTFEATYRSDPHNQSRRIVLGQPFFNLLQSFAWVADFDHTGGQKESFADSILNARWETRGDTLGLTTFYRWGGYERKIGVGLDYSFKDLKTRNVELIAGLPDSLRYDPQNVPDDSILHLFAIVFGVQEIDFISLRRINGYSYLEDHELGFDARLKAGRAYKKGFHAYHYDQLTLSSRYVTHFGSNLAGISAERTFYFNNRDIRRLTSFGLSFYSNVSSFLTMAFRSRYFSDFTDSTYNPLVLGGRNGLRGFNRFASTGNRLQVYNIEARLWPGIELLSVVFGAVVFADIGRTWRASESMTLKDMHSSVGFGLRIAPEALTKTDIIRIDLSKIGADWEVSFGTGQYF